MGFDAFAAGFLNQMNKNISDRKEEARDYYNKKMELAFDKVQEFRSKNSAKLQGIHQTASQMQAAGVPDNIIKAIANQNPDDLGQAYELVQELKTKGVPLDNPDAYKALFDTYQEVGDGEESLTSFLDRIYNPLVANVNANKEGFEFDPKGTFWATAMGYNAMERANQKLANTEVIPGISAADALSYTGQPNTNLLGNHPVSVNATWVGEQTRAAAKANRTDGEMSPMSQKSMYDAFDKLVDDERVKLGTEDQSLSPEERNNIARPKAAIKFREMYGDETLDKMPLIKKWLPTEGGSQSPSEAPTAPVAQSATPTSTEAQSLPQGVPTGSKLAQEWPDGKKGYIGPDGKKYIVLPNSGQATAQPKAPDPDIQALQDLIKYPQGN